VREDLILQTHLKKFLEPVEALKIQQLNMRFHEDGSDVRRNA